MKQKFKVTDMSCSACAAGIEKAVKNIDGVKSVSVSLMGEYMIAEFNESVGEETIITVVKKLGYGCSVFNGVAGKKDKEKQKSYADVLRTRFIISLAFLLPLMYFSMGKMVGLPEPSMTVSMALCWAFASIVIGINYKFFTGGVKAVINRSPNMDTLISLGSFAAYAYSVVISIMHFCGNMVETHVFFESAAMVLTLVTLGKWLEELSKKRTGKEIEKLSDMLPDTVCVKRNGKEEAVSLSSVVKGDVLIVKAGDFLPVDGTVVSGGGGVDKSAITGESLPVEISTGDKVPSGSVLRSGYVEVVAEKVGADTVFSRIIDAVREAGASKAPIQRLADKIAGIFVPVVTAIAIVTFIVWIAVTGDVGRAVNFAVNVLVISCPCSLGLATPVAVMAATGKAANKGVLFKDAEALQKIGNVDCVILDKTATITEGKPKVTDFIVTGEKEKIEKYKSVCSALEAKSSHPLGASVIEFCGKNDLAVENFEYVIGKGVKGEIDGETYYLGSADFVKGENVEIKDYEGAVIYLSDDKKPLAIIKVSDGIKSDSKFAIEKLKSFGILPVMATGDKETVARKVAASVGIDEIRSEVMPEDKLKISEEYKSKGYHVAMCGDGINDSPALKGAYIGVAMGNGTDIAIESSDVVLAGGKLTSLCDAIAVGKKAMKLIKENLFWAFFYNVIAIPIAAGVLVPIGVSFAPWVAGACMSVSSLFVVTNALRINSYKGAEMKKDEQVENKIPAADKTPESVKSVVIRVDGMMCNHCAGKVTEALMAVANVKDVKIDLNKKTATAYYESDKKLDAEALKNAIVNAGYKFVKVVK